MATTPSPDSSAIEDYATIGDRHTVGLVSIDGSIDWLCLPRYDSSSCFSRLLGDPDSSRWLLGPEGAHTSERSYLPGTNILTTVHTTDTGRIRVTDLMPTGDRRADVVRRIEGLEGVVTVRHEIAIRFDYGTIRPWVHRDKQDGENVILAAGGPDKVILAGPRLPRAADGRHLDSFEVSQGECLDFTLTWIPSHREVPPALDIDERITRTIEEQRGWAAGSDYEGPYADQVVRSLLTLHALTHEDTGGIVAAATTSLPEDFGGERNWDYRYSWLRDAALTVETIIGTSQAERAEPWRNWLLRAIAGDPEDMQVMYTVDGGRHLPERELGHLAGFADSRPVRVGNAAVDQRQTDVVGEVLTALAAARDAGLAETPDSWALQRALVNGLAETWRLPDHGIWEIRGPQRHFTHSRVMVWAAFDRAVSAVEQHGLLGPVERWRDLRDEVCTEIWERGFDADRNTFTQHYETAEVDASLLVLPLVGFVAGNDPRMLGTIEAIERDLLRDGLPLRYRTSSGVDGLSGDEHPFVACAFWLVTAYALAGQLEKARALMDRLVGLTNDVGLLSEEYDVTHSRMAGNFPQAYSHLTLVQAARALQLAETEAARRAR